MLTMAILGALEKLSPHPVLLAPMVGLTHFAVRKALNEELPVGYRALWPTEMLSSRRLPFQKEAETPEIIFEDRDAGLSPQLLGNDETLIEKSVKKLEAWGASAIDINMGCPVSQALRHNYGVALMGNAAYAAQVTAATVKHTKLPVSVKLRAGLDEKNPDFLVSFARALESAGASWLTLHPRMADQKRRGSADWSQIRLLKESLNIPVIGNGDIQSAADVHRMRAETNCDRVMVGRALIGKPWIFREVIDPAQAPESPTQAGEWYGKFLKRVLEISRTTYEESYGMRKLRFLVYHGCVWLEFGHFLYAQMKGAETYDEATKVLESFFSQPQAVLERTDRRR